MIKDTCFWLWPSVFIFYFMVDSGVHVTAVVLVSSAYLEAERIGGKVRGDPASTRYVHYQRLLCETRCQICDSAHRLCQNPHFEHVV